MSRTSTSGTEPSGLVAVGVMSTALLVFGWLVRHRLVDGSWTRRVIVLAANTVDLGYGAPVATAGLIGANLELVEVFLVRLILGSLTSCGIVARTLTIVGEHAGAASKHDRAFSHFR